MNKRCDVATEAERRFPMPFDKSAFQAMAATLGDCDLPMAAHWTGETIFGKVHLTDSIQTDWAEGNCAGYVNGYFKVSLQQEHVELYDSPMRLFKLNINCDALQNHKIRISARMDVRSPDGTYRCSPWSILYEG